MRKEDGESTLIEIKLRYETSVSEFTLLFLT